MAEAPEAKADTQVQQLYAGAVALMKVGHHATALTMLRRAEALADTANVHAALGKCLTHLNRWPEARTHLQRACDLDASNPAHRVNLGLLDTSERRYDTAIETFGETQAAWRAKGDEHEAMGSVWNRALVHLKAGDWKRGLDAYEARIPFRGPPLYHDLRVPRWTGQDLTDKRIYVPLEQGLGDRIMVSRLFAEVKRRWPTCHIVTGAGAATQNLLWEFQLAGVLDVLPIGAPIPPEGIDYACYAMSMLRALEITPEAIPADPGLILKRAKAQAMSVPCRLPPPLTQSALKVGIAWTGNPIQQENEHRSIPLDLMLSLAANPRVMLYSLQVGKQAEQLRDCGGQALAYPLGEEIESEGYVGGLSAMLELDLIVTACTSTAHMGGVLGVPTWVLLNTDPYWAWRPTGPKRHQTPWYPSVRLFHQPSPGDWESVMDEVRHELAKLAPMRTFSHVE